MARVTVITITGAPNRRSVEIRASVADGAILPGMVLLVPLNHEVSLDAHVSSVRAEGGQVVLTIPCEDDVEFNLWTGLNISAGEVLESRE